MAETTPSEQQQAESSSNDNDNDNTNTNTANATADHDDDNDWQVQRDQEKSFGDNAFRAQDFATAIHHYTAALSLDPENHIILSNRSAAYLSSHQKSKALYDAQSCVQHAPTDYVKGYSRLAAALYSLGRYGPAKEAWETVLQKDPTNAAAKKGIDDVSQILKSQQKAAKEEDDDDEEEENDTDKKAATKKDDDNNNNEEDDLDDFFNEVETEVEQVKKAVQEEIEHESEQQQPKATNAIKSHKKDLGTAVSQIERLLQPNYEWRNLNPFFVLDIAPDATVEDISRRYKALSLLLHPDKNRNQHDQAELAYDQVQKAKKMLLDDEHKAKHCRDLAQQGMRMGKREWEQLSAADKKAKTTSLEELQTKAVMKIFADIEYKRREVERRQRSQEQRERQQEEEETKKERNAMKFEKNWREEGRVDKRVGNWRDFQKKKKPKDT